VPKPRILLCAVGRPHGVRGLVRVHSYAADPAALAGYGPLFDANGRSFVLTWRGDGIAELAELRDGVPIPVAGRAAAARLTNLRLYVERDRLPPPEADEFYLADLIGLEASDGRGAIGRVVAVHDYGAGASLEIERPGAAPLLVPFTRAAVPEVDIAHARLTVRPPPEIEARPDEEQAAGEEQAA
jgi:16S rRNA processing protein RimM